MNEMSALRGFKTQAAPRGRRAHEDEDAANALLTRRQRNARKLKRNNRNRASKTLRTSREKPQFPRLVDPNSSTQRELLREFLPYAKRAYDYYSQIAAITAYLRAHLNDRTIAANSGGYNAAIPANRDKPMLEYNEFYQKIINNAANYGRYLKIKGDQIQINIAPVSFEVVCKLNTETVPVLQNKLGRLFGGEFKVPTQFARNDKKELLAVTGDYSTGLKPLRYFQRLNYTQDEAPGFYQPAKLETDDAIDKRLENATTIEVKLHTAQVHDTSFSMATAEAGPLSQYSTVRFTFRVLGVATFPMEYALWATHATKEDEFVPKLFREHFDNLGRLAVGLTKGRFIDMLARTMHVGKVKELNAKRIEEYSITVKPRVNADNFCILRNGRVFYVPPTDQADFYVKALKDSYDAETGAVKNSSEIREIQNIPLLTDWINDGFAYTDNNGTVQAQRLMGATALDNVTIARGLNTEFAKWDENFREAFAERGARICAEFNLYDTTPTYANTLTTNFESLFSHIVRYYGTYPFHQIVTDSNKPDEDIVRAKDKPLIKEFVKLCAGIAKNIANSKSYAISTRCQDAYYYHLFGIYVNSYSKYYEDYLTAQQENAPIPRDQMPTKFVLPNLPGIKTVLPHQVAMVAQSMIKTPKFVVMDISAGGGKTFQMMAHIMALKQKGKIKRAVVVCPGRLVSEWTNEVNNASKGAINLVPINTEVIKKMVADLGYDRQKYLQWLKAAPPNTIYVISLNFLRLTTDYFTGERLNGFMQFGEQYIKFFPNVQLLRQLEPDLIFLDESHYAKNAASSRSTAMSSFATCAPNRGIASGTIMQNDPGDMPAQYELINPTILGTKDQFQEKFGVVSRGKFVGLKEGMEGEIAKLRAPYLFAMNRSRRDWSQLLPDINISFLPVEMTEAQQEFYDSILQDEMDKLKSDPGVMKLITSQDETAQEKLEKLLEKKLHVVELFVNAPDANPAFVNSQNIQVKRSDLRSTKSVRCDDIIRLHLEGDRARGVMPDKNKIIVFCYNKEVSKHFWRWTKYQSIGLHYAAGKTEPRHGENYQMTGSEALLRFRQDEKVRILFADETSLREGLNLQMASRIIRVQTLFAPGAQEQAMSRALRPDVADIYKRRQIEINWLVSNRSHEVGKAARMIAKIVINHKKKEEDNSQWTNFIKGTPVADLPLIRLNLELLSEPSMNTISLDSTGNMRENSALREYFESYQIINNWEIKEFDLNRKQLRESTAKRLGVDPDKVNVRTDSQIPLDGSSTLPGSKSIWVPLANGAMPVDIRNLNLKPLAVLEELDEDEDEDDDDRDDEQAGNLIDNITYEPGDMVQTEYGFGRIVSVQVKQVRVQINGFQNAEGSNVIGLNKQVVYKATPPSADTKSQAYLDWLKRVKQLEKDYKAAGAKGITFVQGTGIAKNIPTPTPVKTRDRSETEDVKPSRNKPTMIVKRDEEEQEEETTRKKNLRNIPKHAPKPSPTSAKRPDTGKRIFIDAMVINGLPALMAYADEDGFSQLEEYAKPWWRIPPFLNARIRTYQGAENLVKLIKREFPNTDDSTSGTYRNLNNLLTLAKKMRSKTSNGLRVRRAGSVPVSAITNFMKVEHTVTNSKKYIKIFPVVYNDELFACAPIAVQQTQAQILRRATISGMDKFDKADEVAVYFATNVNKMRRTLEHIAENERLRNYNETISIISNPDFKNMVGG